MAVSTLQHIVNALLPRHGSSSPVDVVTDHEARPTLQVMPFFNRVGFQLPERKGIADFLQEVTSPKDQGEL
jgi:hypothetical protein